MGSVRGPDVLAGADPAEELAEGARFGAFTGLVGDGPAEEEVEDLDGVDLADHLDAGARDFAIGGCGGDVFLDQGAIIGEVVDRGGDDAAEEVDDFPFGKLALAGHPLALGGNVDIDGTIAGEEA